MLILDKVFRKERLKEILDVSLLNHDIMIMNEDSLKDAHIYCVIYKISGQQYGPFLEKYIRTKFNYVKNKAEKCIGDCSKNGHNVEIKVSLGGSHHNKFNFVQLRPSHKCDFYILTAYHLCVENVDNEGELYIFKIPHEKIKKLIVDYGSYAHGTVKEHGVITMESVNKNDKKEYALRPIIGDSCWNFLLEFRIRESEL